MMNVYFSELEGKTLPESTDYLHNKISSYVNSFVGAKSRSIPSEIFVMRDSDGDICIRVTDDAIGIPKFILNTMTQIIVKFNLSELRTYIGKSDTKEWTIRTEIRRNEK